jgi:3-isopropylmalate/(R)-2-methylmalate dehydratase small subunit
MQPLVVHTGKAMPLRKTNVDTDQIFPAHQLRGVSKIGLGDAVLYDWRLDPDFVFNDPAHAGASILVAGTEFGTGSSREWAVWALVDYGFRVIFSPRFGDIFRGNAANNGVVAATLPQAAIERLWAQVEAEPEKPLTVDLVERRVSVGELAFTFEYPEEWRWQVMNGLDEIQLTLNLAEQIDGYESRRRGSLPRIDRPKQVS